VTRCTQHPAFDADYCPTCGTTTPIGDRSPSASSSAAERGTRVLAEQASPFVVGAVQLLLDHDLASWQWDPEVGQVAGLLDHGTGQAWVIVYADGDWEVSSSLELSAREGASS
jgi:hypothetical protein